MNDSPTSDQPKKRRSRKPRKDMATPSDASVANDPSVVAALALQDVGDIASPPVEKKRRPRTPRKRKTPVEAAPEMIAPAEPIASAPTAAVAPESVAEPGGPLGLAVPVGPSFAPPLPARVKPSALTPQVVSLRASMLVPLEPHVAEPAASDRWRLPGFVSKATDALPKISGVLRRHPRSVGLAMTALLLGISLTTAAMFSLPAQRSAAEQTKPAPELAAAAPVAQSSMETRTEQPARTGTAEAAGAAEESDALAGVRIVDPSWDGASSCKDSVWPYIDQRCVVKEDTAKAGTRTETKIGPRSIDIRPQLSPSARTGPIGSTTAVVPASPKVNATDGLGLGQFISGGAETDGRATKEDVDPEATDAPARDVPAIRTAPVQAVETQASAMQVVRQASPAPRSRKSRQMETFRLTEETTKAPPRRAAQVKRKKYPSVAASSRRTRVVNNAVQPQPPQFLFPFGWFVQAR